MALKIVKIPKALILDRLIQTALTLLFAFLFEYGYINYSYANFEYAGYVYYERSFIESLQTYVLAIIPSIFIVRNSNASYVGLVLVYVVIYIPSQLTILFSLSSPVEERIAIQIALFISIFILIAFSNLKIGRSSQNNKILNKYIVSVVVFFSVMVLVSLVASYHQYMRFVGFADVYDLRFETNAVQISLFLGYAQMWVTYLLIPLFLALGICKKYISYIALALIMSVTIYLIQGSKLAILMFFIVYVMLFFYKSRFGFYLAVVLYLSLIMIVLYLLPDMEVMKWVKSLLFIRSLGTPAWTIVHYYEFFTLNGFSYYGHIGPVNALFDNYPYGNLALGQVIGLEYSGSSDANFNANFWASEGIASIGVLGLPLISIIVGFVFLIFNYVSKGFDNKFIFILLVGFWQAMLNMPFATAMLSGGGVIIIILLFLNKFKTNIR